MALTFKDRVLETSVSIGTGDFVLGGAQNGYQGFGVVGDGATVPYTIQGKNADGTLTGDWEVGIGTYHVSGNYISRDTVLESSNSNAKVYFPAGDKDIFLDLPGELIVQGPSSATNGNLAVFDGTTGKVLKDNGYAVGAANGVASLDSSGKVPLSQIPALGDLNYQGAWDASTNTPTLTSSVGTKGYYYVVSVSGSTNLNGITDWVVGDWAVFNGSIWQKIDNTDAGGDVIGPSSATDNAIVRFDGTTGKLIQSSAVTIDDAGNIVSPDSVQFSGTVPATQPIGTLWFDSSNDSLNLQQNNIVQQIGEEIYIYGRASEAITDGQVIAVSGAYGTTGFVTFEPAPIGTTDPTHIIGLATEPIAKNGFGRITAFGIVHGLSTSPGYADGDALWYDPTVVGGYTKTQPSAPNIKVQIGVVTKAAGGTNGSIQVKVFNGPTINDIANIQVTTPTGGQLLTYNATGGYWKNTSLTAGTAISVTPAAGGGITITNSAPDQVVSLTGAGTTTVTGTYPNFTITSNDAYVGTVTSVSGTGTVNGITLTGTVTSSGSLTLGGTLSGIGNSQLTNSSVTVNGTTIALGASGTITAATSNALTAGSYLTSTGTFDGSVARTFAVDATSANTASKVVARDASGNFSAGTVTVSGLSDSGNLTFTGTGNRITGDFSNVTVANRVNFQTSTTNGGTYVSTLPLGTGNISGFFAYNAADGDNASVLGAYLTNAVSIINSSKNGTGSYLPMTFYTSGSEKFRIAADTTGTFTFSGTAPRITGDFSNATLANRVYVQNSVANATTVFGVLPNGTGTTSTISLFNNSDPTNSSFADLRVSGTSDVRLTSNKVGTGSYLPMTFYTNNTEAMRIDTSGNVGIGTSSPSSFGKLAILTTSGSNMLQMLTSGNTSGLYINSVDAVQASINAYGAGLTLFSTSTGYPVIFGTNNTERMRIDSSGNVGIGTSSPTQKLEVNGAGLFKTGTNDYIHLLSDSGAIEVVRSTGDAYIDLKNTTSEDYDFRIQSIGTTGVGRLAAVDSQQFYTATTERMRIDSSGNLLVGKTQNDLTTAGFSFIPANGGANIGAIGLAGAASTNGANGYHMYSTNAAAYRFYVGYGGTIYATSTTITGISDIRLKENIEDLPDGLDAVMALKPRKFDWKEGKGKDIKGDRGFIAQEFENVFPDMIDNWADPAPEGEEPYKAVNANLIPTLVKAIQEQQAIIEQLKADVEALKGAK